ncbi:MAG: hypothetical protein H0V17_03780 [Deltaproteobacteria bacterium]|nr:hypothetical protein [Deltaproteobacteria bacterium]
MRNLGVLAALCLVACAPQRPEPGPGDPGPDADPGDPGDPGDPPVQTFVYAHTSSDLYRVDPDSLAVQLIGPFSFTTGSDQITDIAINKAGTMIGISFNSVYRIDPSNAAATRLSDGLSGLFNGLSFMPADQIGQTGDDILVATRNADGVVWRVDPMTGGTTMIGNMGAFSSSGDCVSVAQLGTLQTADNGISADRLVRLAPNTFQAQTVGTDIGFSDIWGIAFWKDKVFGFTNGGEFITIDPVTGVGTLVQGNGPSWWGAAVTTLAPVVL